jgi:AraC family transcriptional regulator
MKTSTLNGFGARVDRVLRLITDHLDEPLALEQLAGAAVLSTFHFHRVWRATMGEPIMETVRRLKLERAAHQLATTGAPITQIALQSGFASSQSFAHAFRQVMGRTPSEVRAGGMSVIAPRPQPTRDAPMAVEIVSLDPFTIVAKRHLGPYTTGDLAATFGSVWAWATGQGLVSRFRGICGVPIDDPASVPAEEIRYDAGFDFGPDIQPGPGLHVVTLGGGQIARVRVLGSYAGLDAAHEYLYGTWFPASERELADAPLFHRFHNDPDVTPEADLVTDVCLPLL